MGWMMHLLMMEEPPKYPDIQESDFDTYREYLRKSRETDDSNETIALAVVLPAACLFFLAAFITFICTCCGITCIDPNQAVFMTYCTKYIGTMK